VELGVEGAEDLCHHDAVYSSPIDERISDIREDMIIEGVATKREKHEVMPPLVVERRGFQNDRDHRSYVLEAGSLRMQVRSEGGVEVGADIDGVIVVIILGDRDPLGSGEILFQVTSDGLLLLLDEDGGTLAHPCLIQSLARGSHSNNESLLLPVHGSGSGLSRGRDIIVLPLGGGCDGLLPIDSGEVRVAGRYGRQNGG
jgi:hypothetical protein